jgi:hypothetical protein
MTGDRPIDNLHRLGAYKAGLYYAMRFLPFAVVRRAIAAFTARWVERRHPSGARRSRLADSEREQVETVRQKGWVYLGPVLPAHHVAGIVDFLRHKDLIAADGRQFVAAAAPPDVKLASYPVRTVLECPHVIELMNRPDMLRIAAEYLGCTPTISGLRIDWSTPSDTPGNVQEFHRDYDDWRFIKLFMYLTDVDDDSGPHEFVATSHLRSGRLRARPYQRAELERDYGPQNLVRVRGPSGTCFMVDTWGVHKGNAPLAKQRVMLQVQYSILPVLKFDYQPVEMAAKIPIDRYNNRLLLVAPK